MFPPPYVHEKMRARKDVLLSPPQYVYSFTAFFVRGKKVLGCDAMHHRPFSWPTIDTWNEGPVWSVPYLAPHGLTERLAVIPALVMWGAGGTVEERSKRNQSSFSYRRVGNHTGSPCSLWGLASLLEEHDPDPRGEILGQRTEPAWPSNFLPKGNAVQFWFFFLFSLFSRP